MRKLFVSFICLCCLTALNNVLAQDPLPTETPTVTQTPSETATETAIASLTPSETATASATYTASPSDTPTNFPTTTASALPEITDEPSFAPLVEVGTPTSTPAPCSIGTTWTQTFLFDWSDLAGWTLINGIPAYDGIWQTADANGNATAAISYLAVVPSGATLTCIEVRHENLVINGQLGGGKSISVYDVRYTCGNWWVGAPLTSCPNDEDASFWLQGNWTGVVPIEVAVGTNFRYSEVRVKSITLSGMAATPTATPTPTATATPTATPTPTPGFCPARSSGASVENTPGSTPCGATRTPTVTPTSTLYCIVVNRTIITTSEGGTPAIYNVRLNRAPAAGESVTITLQLIFHK